jgi:hypothetical protein
LTSRLLNHRFQNLLYSYHETQMELSFKWTISEFHLLEIPGYLVVLYKLNSYNSTVKPRSFVVFQAISGKASVWWWSEPRKPHKVFLFLFWKRAPKPKKSETCRLLQIENWTKTYNIYSSWYALRFFCFVSYFIPNPF